MATPESGVNDDQSAYWNGEAGKRWVDGQEAMDVMLAPFGEKAMDAVGVPKGAEIIDLGCGCGGTTLELARRTGPMGRVLGIDISTPMLRRAQQRAGEAGLAHTLFINTDASTHGFEAQKADLAFSRFGVMFFANPIPAFRNIRAAMRPDARLTFACWRPVEENEWVTVPRDVALRHVAKPEPMKPGAPGPFAFADPKHVATVLGTAGFRGVTLARFDQVMRHEGSVEEVADGVARSGPASRLIVEAASDDIRGRIMDDMRALIARRHDGKGVDLNSAAWIVTASA